MKLSKVNYESAIFFGVLALVVYLIVGALELAAVAILPELASYIGTISPLQVLIKVPVILGLIYFLFFLIAILIYNIVARKFPISWEVKNK